MSFSSDWTQATHKQPESGAKGFPHVVTDGLADDESVMTAVYFAQAVRRKDGFYDVDYAQSCPEAYFFQSEPGPRKVCLREALEHLHEWETRHKGFYAVTGRETGQDGALHFSHVARQMGMKLGPEGNSLRHAALAKRTLNYRNKARGHG